MKRTTQKLLIQLAREALACRNDHRDAPDDDSDAMAKVVLELRGTLATLRLARVSIGSQLASEQHTADAGRSA